MNVRWPAILYSGAISVGLGALAAYIVGYRLSYAETCAVALYTPGVVADDGKVASAYQCVLKLADSNTTLALAAIIGLVVSHLVNLVILRGARLDVAGGGFRAFMGGDRGEAADRVADAAESEAEKVKAGE